MIKQETIRSIIDTARIDEVIGDFVSLKKRGANYLGLCPFHNEKTPSFTVSPTKGIYKCFGCGRAGDVIRFVMENDQMTYPEALKYLAARYGIEVEEEYKGEKQKEAESLRESMLVVNHFAADHFEDRLWNDEKGKAIALSYFTDRGFDEKTIKHFNLGYCLDEWDDLTKSALNAGYKEEFLEKTGLSIKKNDKHFDRFRGRVMFPIHNLSGRVIGFGGRTLKSDKNAAKYVNSPESEVYSKSHQLYGLHFAKKSVVQLDHVYLVEGYTDVVSLFQSGVENAVAPLGTSLTEDQVKLIRRYTKNVVLLFDGDEAGMKAALRGIDIVLESGMNVKVVTFPEGQDPDSYSQAHSDEELKEFLENSQKDFIEFQLHARKDDWQRDPIKKAELMKEIIGSIAKIPDHLLRSMFIRQFSQMTEVDEKSAIFELNRLRRQSLKKQYHDEVVPPETEKFTQHNEEAKQDFDSGYEKKEEKIIEYLFKFGAQKLHIEVNDSDNSVEIHVADYIVGEIIRDDIQFIDSQFQMIFETYQLILEEDRIPEQTEIMTNLNDNAKNVFYNVVASKYQLHNWEKYHIYTKTEEDDLKKSIDNALYHFKCAYIDVQMEKLAISEEAKNSTNFDELRKYNQLRQAKRAFDSKLNKS